MCEGTKALEDIDTKPPQTVADNAARALEVRAEKPESMRGMTEVGIARARDLSNRVNLSEETIRRMAAYFERHQSDKDGQTWDEQGPGWQAWMGWGGDEGWAWARRKVEEFDRAREGAKSCGCGCGAASTKAVRASDLWTKGAADEFDAITERERLLSRGVGAVLTDQITEVIAEIRKAGAPSAEMVSRIERLITANRWNIALVDALRPYLADAMEVGVSVAVDTLRKVEGVPTFEPPTEQLAAFTQVESTRLARVAGRSVNEYTAVQIRDLVETGIEEGKTVDELAAKVQEWADETGDTYRRAKDRAVRVARTEAQRAARSAEVETWAQTGLVEGKTWLLAPSPCEFCAEAAKRFEKNAVALDGSFFARGSTLTTASGKTMVLDYEDIKGPPLHPNCRCSLMPRLSDELERLAAKAEGSGAGARTVDAIMAEYERSKG